VFLSDACSVIRPKLEPGEAIRWCARPSPWAAARWPLVYIAGGIFLVAIVALIPDGRGPIGLCIALYSIGRGIVELLNCWDTVYAITDRRLIIEVALGRTQSLAGERVSTIRRTGSDTWGTIIVACREPPGMRLRYFRLDGIPAPAQVETLLRDTLLNRSPKLGGDA
jgi:hypothetical protein